MHVKTYHITTLSAPATVIFFKPCITLLRSVVYRIFAIRLSSIMATELVDNDSFYGQYHGHPIEHLRAIVTELRRDHRSLIFFAGDSSLDNKYWFENSRYHATNGYERVMRYARRMKPDVCYWFNRELVKRNLREVACVNTAVEATSLNSRSMCRLTPQDKFIRSAIKPQDYLVVSIGGNDIALHPLLCTVVALLNVGWCTPQSVLERHTCSAPMPHTAPCLAQGLDPGCFCCGAPGCVTGATCGCPPGFGYLTDLFRNRIEAYILRVLDGTRPRRVAVCMIYNPDEKVTGGWADGALSVLLYNRNPGKVQAVIRALFEQATCRIRIPGVQVVPVPLFKVLDGKTSEDYCQRVEPSPTGGQKMARFILDCMDIARDEPVVAEPKS